MDSGLQSLGNNWSCVEPLILPVMYFHCAFCTYREMLLVECHLILTKAPEQRVQFSFIGASHITVNPQTHQFTPAKIILNYHPCFTANMTSSCFMLIPGLPSSIGPPLCLSFFSLAHWAINYESYVILSQDWWVTDAWRVSALAAAGDEGHTNLREQREKIMWQAGKTWRADLCECNMRDEWSYGSIEEAHSVQPDYKWMVL